MICTPQSQPLTAMHFQIFMHAYANNLFGSDLEKLLLESTILRTNFEYEMSR